MTVKSYQIIVLFVCTGNICRSPTAEGLFLSMAASLGITSQVRADSAGTSNYHIGEAPDWRTRRAALAHGLDLGKQRARQVNPEDFDTFNYLIAMDQTHLDELARLSPTNHAARIGLLLDYAPEMNKRNVPDPYFGGVDGFTHVLDLIEAGVAGLLQEVRRTIKSL
mgnify:CR=1 FL=1